MEVVGLAITGIAIDSHAEIGSAVGVAGPDDGSVLLQPCIDIRMKSLGKTEVLLAWIRDEYAGQEYKLEQRII